MSERTPENDVPAWGRPVTGHVHTAGMTCRECRVIPPTKGQA